MTDWASIWPESIDPETGEDASIGNEAGGPPIGPNDDPEQQDEAEDEE